MAHRDQQLLKDARKGHIERITRSLDDGANVNCRGKYGVTPLMEAASQGHVSTVRYLLDCGADPLIGEDDNAPPTFYACVRGFTEVVEILLKAGADPNALRESDCEVAIGDSRGVSQLGIAIRNGFPKIALALINAGANIDHVFLGKTPFDLALEAEMTDAVNRLREVDRQRKSPR